MLELKLTHVCKMGPNSFCWMRDISNIQDYAGALSSYMQHTESPNCNIEHLAEIP